MKNKRKVILMALALLCFNISFFAQGIDLDIKNVSVKEAIAIIEAKTGYSFVFSSGDLDSKKKVTIKSTNQSVNTLLTKLLVGQNVMYEVKDKTIIIKKKQQELKQNQKKKIRGVVTDSEGEPVIGATIMEKDSRNGTVTDLDGLFEITVESEASHVLISCVGYTTYTLSVAGKTDFTIELSESAKALDEVIVLGYGSTSAKKMISSVTALKGEKVVGLPDATLSGSLQGRAAGVIVQQKGGEPGSTPSISIRGGGDPLYVIDGVIASGWDFNMINPVDIESMSILKDASSLAVYGSRAADGIIMVKTKQGKKDKTSINYSFNAQFSKPTVLPDKIDSYTYAKIQNKAAMNDGYPDYHMYDQQTLETIKNQTDPYRLANTDWLSLGLKSYAPEYRHSLSMNGNSKEINYYLSLGAFQQGSFYKTDALNYDRYTLRSNVNTTFESIGLTVALNVNGAIEKKEYPSFGAGVIWDHLFSRTPIMPAYNEDGTYRAQTDHPLVEMDKRSGYTKHDEKFINTQFVADWAVPYVSGLTIGTMLNYRLYDKFEKLFSAVAPQYTSDGTLYKTSKPSLKETAKFEEEYNFELNAGWLGTIAKDHTIEAKGVFTASERNGDNFWASRKEYLSTSVDQLFAGSPIGQLNSGNANEGGRMGFVGRLKYDFSSRYYIEGSFRYDGSDNFAKSERWGLFPSVALGWDITEEPLFKSFELANVNLLKFRGSYGQTGTEDGVNRFGYIPVYNMQENAIVIGGNLQSGFQEGNLVAPEELTWYTRNAINYGLDFAFFNNRLSGNADYFYYITKGGLVSPKGRYTTPLGKNLPQVKSKNEHRREGFEIALRWKDEIVRDLTYDIGVNMTYFENMWYKKEDESLSSLMNPWQRITHSADYYNIGFIAEGLYQTEEQLLNAPRRSQATELKLGDIMFKDLNNDGHIDDNDRTRIGSPQMPNLTYGIDFAVGYKGFTLSGLLYGTGNRNVYFERHYRRALSTYILDEAQLDYWREDNRGARFPRISTNDVLNGDNNGQSSSYWLMNASFFRLKNLQLSYDFKHKLLKNTKWLSTCRLNLTGTNLFTVSDVMDYFDPETAGTIGSYPVLRTYSLGLTVGF